MRSFTIDVQGQRYQAAWLQRGSDSVEVRSHYGSRAAPLRGREPAIVAREVLRSIVAQLYELKPGPAPRGRHAARM
jgi:hypothetical protein